MLLNYFYYRICAHRHIVSALNPFFAAMFQTPMKEMESREVTLTGIDGDSLKGLVDFCYTGDIEIKEENVEGLLAAATQLQFAEVAQRCSNLLLDNLSTSNCLGILSAAHLYHLPELMSVSKQFACDHFKEVSKEDEFAAMSFDHFEELMDRDDLSVDCEEDVFHTIFRWVRFNETERMGFLGKLLPLLRMKRLSLTVCYGRSFS